MKWSYRAYVSLLSFIALVSTLISHVLSAVVRGVSKRTCVSRCSENVSQCLLKFYLSKLKQFMDPSPCPGCHFIGFCPITLNKQYGPYWKEIII